MLISVGYTSQLISKLKNDKGVTFRYEDEQSAEGFLYDRNNYMRTASYRKNYVKYTKGLSKGKYINLDFGYLKELSILDMHLRDIIVRLDNTLFSKPEQDYLNYKLNKASYSNGLDLRNKES